MRAGADGGWHIDSSFYEFSLLDLRHEGVAPLEFGTREAIAGFEERFR